MIKLRKHKHPIDKKWLIVTGAVLVVVVALIVLKLTSGSSTNQPTEISNTNTANQSTKGESATKVQAEPDNITGNSGDGALPGKDGDSATQTDNTLLAPSGTYISNHNVKLSDSNQLSVQSNCTTTPGATCVITFTKGSTKKSLTAVQTDAGGAAYWAWNVKDLGLTIGTWQIKATSTLNGQTQTSTDATNLEITP